MLKNNILIFSLFISEDKLQGLTPSDLFGSRNDPLVQGLASTTVLSVFIKPALDVHSE